MTFFLLGLLCRKEESIFQKLLTDLSISVIGYIVSLASTSDLPISKPLTEKGNRCIWSALIVRVEQDQRN